mgnify:CR=1 FL=1
MSHYFANTHQQDLSEHLFAVGLSAYYMTKELTGDIKLSRTAYIAGVLHDIGKADPSFQAWLAKSFSNDISINEGVHIDASTGKFSFDKYPRHNEISLLLYHLLEGRSFQSDNKLNREALKTIKHVIYWHHAKPIRKKEFTSYEDIHQTLSNVHSSAGIQAMFEGALSLIGLINNHADDYLKTGERSLAVNGLNKTLNTDILYDLESLSLPNYKYYSLNNIEPSDYLSNTLENARNNIVRSAVISADRLISSLSATELSEHIKCKSLKRFVTSSFAEKPMLSEHLKACLTGFEHDFPDSERNDLQSDAAQELALGQGISVLAGPAGCGKSKIALEWALDTDAKRIIWICPRIQVCQGLFHDLTQNNYLPDARIEINTGDIKQTHQSDHLRDTDERDLFSGDIVITTIDQITNAILTHKNVSSLMMYMNSHIVFDEFHEYINMDAFNLLFSELVQCKRYRGDDANTLLVSATPNYNFLNEMLEIDNVEVVSIDSFNTTPYRVQFESFDEATIDHQHPFYRSQAPNTFVISNTAVTAQQSFVSNHASENGILLHSKFTKTDKALLFDKVMASFEKNGTHDIDILRSGPLVQASLNISCKHMLTEFTSPENWLQRLGRNGRFGEYEETLNYITAIPETLLQGKRSGSCASFLRSLNVLDSSMAWFDFISEKLQLVDNVASLADLYNLYYEYYTNNDMLKIINQDLTKALAQSAKVINDKVMDPLSAPSFKAQKDNKTVMKEQSLRGNNRFAQMAVCHVQSNGDLNVLNQYVYDEKSSNENMTLPVDVFSGRGNSGRDLLAFMSKHHQAIEQAKDGNLKTVKAQYKDQVLLNKARYSTSPVYVSYTPEDLALIRDNAHDHAIYYIQCDAQAVGVMSLKQLNQ